MMAALRKKIGFGFLLKAARSALRVDLDTLLELNREGEKGVLFY